MNPTTVSPQPASRTLDQAPALTELPKPVASPEVAPASADSMGLPAPETAPAEPTNPLLLPEVTTTHDVAAAHPGGVGGWFNSLMHHSHEQPKPDAGQIAHVAGPAVVNAVLEAPKDTDVK